MDAFTRAVNFVLEHEGGYVNDSRDPGGETNFGICKRAYPALDIKALTRRDAISIYQRDYWTAAKCPLLPPAVAAMHFDTAVNQGVGAAARLLQEAAGTGVDGKIGPATLAAVGRKDVQTLLNEYAARRALRYAGTANFDRFGLGWLRRLTACLSICNTILKE